MQKNIDYRRIEKSVDHFSMRLSRVVLVGVGASFSLALALARSGIGKITVIDPDVVEETNLARQGYNLNDIGCYKVDALEKTIKQIRPDIDFEAIPKKLQDLTEDELDMTFKKASVALYMTDSFEAQARGNEISLEYFVPSIWAGWYLDSRMAEIVISAPHRSKSCYRCICSSRYTAFEKGTIPKTSSVGNTMFHALLLDGMVGQLATALLHYPKCDDPIFNLKDVEAERFIGNICSDTGHHLKYNLLQFSAHPLGGNRLFDTYGKHSIPAPTFTSYWQNVEPELKRTGYPVDCPDCKGILLDMIEEVE